MIQQKMAKKAYFLGMMNGERLHGELLVSYWCMCESSGFVEGNNNKFKLLKRIVYGTIGLVNLAKKCNKCNVLY